MMEQQGAEVENSEFFHVPLLLSSRKSPANTRPTADFLVKTQMTFLLRNLCKMKP